VYLRCCFIGKTGLLLDRICASMLAGEISSFWERFGGVVVCVVVRIIKSLVLTCYVLPYRMSINDPAHFHPPNPLRYSPNKSNPPSQTNVGSWLCLQWPGDDNSKKYFTLQSRELNTQSSLRCLRRHLTRILVSGGLSFRFQERYFSWI
jgi:hypothetical protein